jgi:competence protein ComEC
VLGRHTSTTRDYYCLGFAVLASLALTAVFPGAGLAVCGVLAALTLCLAVGRNVPGFTPLLRQLPPAPVWGLAAVLALLATGYFYLRLPQPGPTDISRVLSAGPSVGLSADRATVQVVGRVTELPMHNRSGKWRFFLEAERYQLLSAENTPEDAGNSRSGFGAPTTGQVYTTLPAGKPERASGTAPDIALDKSCTNLQPGQRVQITGQLYLPKATGKGQFYAAFDFQKFLASQSSFAGLAGQRCQRLSTQSSWGLWMIRQRIATAQAAFLGQASGAVLSSMVLGNRAVQVPFGISDQFRRVGLSHALAASGFQVSLILATVMALTRRQPQARQLLWGGVALLVFGCLSGFAPSVLRAVLMGVAGLLAMVKQSQIKPLPVLLAVALVMLLLNPLWISDLGFQFSFLATLGLMLSATPIAQRLDLLPPRIADWLAVPLAATLWVMPLQLAQFGLLPLYGLVVNGLVAPLLTVITVGGFGSALIALVWPWLGSVTAWLLTYPLALLLGIAGWFSQLPGSSVAVGAISVGQMLLLYGLLIGFACQPNGKIFSKTGNWRWGLWLGLMLVLVPFGYTQLSQERVTVLDNARLPMLVVQSPGANIVLNGGANPAAASFLATQGVNPIDWAIASRRNPQGWLTLAQEVTLRRFSQITTANRDNAPLAQLPASIQQQPLGVGEPQQLGRSRVTVLRAEPLALDLDLLGKRWLLLQDSRGNAGHELWLASHPIPKPEVLWWVGQPSLTALTALVPQLQPQVVILSSTAAPAGLPQLQAQYPQIEWFNTQQDGAVQWDGQRFLANLPEE